MAKNLKTSGARSSATDLIASPSSKRKSLLVSQPLTRSEINWLKQRSKHVAEASSLRSDLRIKNVPSAQLKTAAGKVLGSRKSSKSAKTVAASVLTRAKSA